MLLKVAGGIAHMGLGGVVVALALVGAFGASMDMDPPYAQPASYLWVAVAGVAVAAIGCVLLCIGLLAKK